MYRNRSVRDMQRQWQAERQRYLDYIDRLLDRIQRPERLDAPVWQPIATVDEREADTATPLVFDLENVG